ncbi:DNA repair ATPase [Kitasatospora sp. CB01950]|uniref:DNA repair ATPase n=1 Tax=Kitasatospora sp. CB01950 TaxID=1703930 RepID=UPI00093C756E|nr:DNA repair ATPase [Kitasatospora sp. CB01950]OKJ16139.1 DNA repair ATPase [Kitasatospora sp. CB01950]
MAEDVDVDTGTYEVLRARLAAAAAELTGRATALNARRVAEFGAGELQLTGTGRLATAGACTLRDAVGVGGLLLVGRNPAADADRGGGDVLSLHRPDLTDAAPEELPGLLDDPRFRQDLAELYRYFRDARLEQLRLIDGRLLAVFRTGPAAGDLRVLRWQLGADGSVSYQDARGERSNPPGGGQEVEWRTVTRDDHLAGPQPQADLGGELRLATAGGTLALSTPAGAVLHQEPLAEPLQTLADADIAHARLDTLLLVRIRPYQEQTARHLVCHLPTGRVSRIDALGQACLLLPGDQGLAFPGGYHLTDGSVRAFDHPTAGLGHERTVRSPNGEDILFVFRDPADGRTLLLPYNTVRQEAAAPLACQGHALLDDGTLIALRGGDDGPALFHPVQVWRTPFTSERYRAAQPPGHGPLARIGNPDLVRGLADCLAVARLAAARTDTAAGHTAVLAACTRTADRHHWLGETGLGDLHEPLHAIRDTARQALAEYETVARLTEAAAAAVDRAAQQVETLLRLTRGESPDTATGWVGRLTELRRAQGRVEALRELRRADTAHIDRLAAHLSEGLTEAAGRAVAFLARPDAFTDQLQQAAALTEAAESLTASADGEPLAEQIAAQAETVQVVGELVAELDLADLTVRTGILDRLADVLAETNRARAALTRRRRELRTREAAAEFAAESSLLTQATTAALATADTPEACDEQLGRLLLRVEQLETRFADADPALTDRLTTRRTEIHDTLTTRRQALLDERAARADRLARSADRVLEALHRELTALTTAGDIDAALAAGPTAAKVRQLADRLRGLGDPVRAGELAGRLGAAREQAQRALRDRADLYTGDGSALRLGRHLFTVTTRRPELTLLAGSDAPAFVLTGTDYRSPVTDPAFRAARHHWGRQLASETPRIYRAEYLAAGVLLAAEPAGLDDLHEADGAGRLLDLVRRAIESRPDEGYQRGVHDHDATAVLSALLRLHADAGALRHPAAARSAARLFWAHGTDDTSRAVWAARARSLALARDAYGPVPALDDLAHELDRAIGDFTRTTALPGPPGGAAGRYLVDELARRPVGFATRPATVALLDKFHAGPDADGLTEALHTLPDEPAALRARHQLASAWLTAFTTASGHDAGPDDLAEAAALLCAPTLPRYAATGAVETTVTGLRGDHPLLNSGALTVRLAELLTRTAEFATHEVPDFRAHQQLRTALLDAERTRLRLDQYRPAPLNGFVRNRLIDEVYLPLLGDNLAKQLGTADSDAGPDRSGLLLLLSPPGYGKTTLVEYLADRLGLLLVKVSGPALGHRVTSLDPAEAPNATARQEIEKINFALHAGSNVLLYLDDVQHTSPELLQRFIPLCDAQRRIDGVWDGRAREWDLRGKRFAVVMAANPYTESGRQFRIPDMLANRADVWNLGDVLAGRDDLFALSFLENALTANPHLAPLAARIRTDLEALLRRAENGPDAAPLAHPYPADELDRILAVLAKLLRARRTVLDVNRAYIASAAQADHTRTEPPFLLQGSYRNMNKIAQRVAPVMDDTELDALIADHYRAEAQALGAAAEAQLLKLAELRSTLTPAQAERWDALKSAHRQTG